MLDTHTRARHPHPCPTSTLVPGAYARARSSYSLVCLVALVLKTVAVEAVSGTAIDVDRELRAAGLASVLSGTLGGAVANHSSSYVSQLRRSSGCKGLSNNRVGVATLLLTACVLISGPPLMNVLPRRPSPSPSPWTQPQALP